MNTNAELLFEMINARNSDGLLSDPAPSDEELAFAIQAGLTAPDHHRLQPWRFLTVQGDARIKMGEVLHQALVARGETDEEMFRKVRAQPLRAPLILVCVVHVQEHPKVPVQEQILSTGAAVENILLMIKALGYGAMWRTGAITGSPVVKQAFGLAEQDIIVGFVYIGSLSREMPVRERISVDGFLKAWD
ncbi:MAG: nitroreductase [Aquirhabdus sp.]